MTANSGGASGFTRREIAITRLFAAPRELVFKAWTDPQQIARWWGPRGFTNPVCELDLRIGGALRIVMRGPDGVDYPMSGVFREIVPPERLVFSSDALDAQGNRLLDGLVTVTFAEQDGKTLLTLRASASGLAAAAAAAIDGMQQGWSESLDRLDALLAAT